MDDGPVPVHAVLTIAGRLTRVRQKKGAKKRPVIASNSNWKIMSHESQTSTEIPVQVRHMERRSRTQPQRKLCVNLRGLEVKRSQRGLARLWDGKWEGGRIYRRVIDCHDNHWRDQCHLISGELLFS